MLDHPVGRTLKRLFDANDFPWLLPLPPWACARDRQVRRIRRAGRTALRRQQVAERGWGAVLAAAAVWPAVALLKAGLDARSAPPLHRSRLLSLLDAWWLQIAHNLRLADQHYFRLEIPAQRRQVRRFVTDGENKTLLMYVNRDLPSRNIGDKRPFAEFCARHRLPTVPVLTTCAGGGAAPEPLASWPAGELFFKPATGWGGEGAAILRPDSACGTWTCDRTTGITPDTIAAFARARVGGAAWLLQPRLTNGPDWAAFTPGDCALATVRVVTGRILPTGPVQLLAGFMRFPLRSSTVDNLSAGGLGSDYDIATGRLHRARKFDPGSPLYTHHPDTAAPIEGAVIPRWDEIAALARRAHEPLTEIATVGWDVALPAAGPILLEANPNWGVPLDTALGDTPYVDYLLQPAVASRFPC